MNLQPELMLPDASVVQVVGMPAAEPSYVTVRLCEAMRLEPVIVTDVPTAPNEGLRETVGTVLAKTSGGNKVSAEPRKVRISRTASGIFGDPSSLKTALCIARPYLHLGGEFHARARERTLLGSAAPLRAISSRP